MIRPGQLEARPGEELELERAEADRLLESGAYERSSGLYPGQHWRTRAPDGIGCYHLRRSGGRSFLHYDRIDPRKNLIGHLAEPQVIVPITLAALLAAVLWRAHA